MSVSYESIYHSIVILFDNLPSAAASEQKKLASIQSFSVQSYSNLEKLVLKSHISLRLETKASTEDIGQSRTLLSQSIDHGCARRSQWSLVKSAKVSTWI